MLPTAQVYCGDLVSDNFGLTAAEWDEIAAANTTFIHNGADVNFSCAVEELLPCNVKGTRTALRLAAQGGMRFCHVSSLSVFSLYHFVGDAATKRPDPRILLTFWRGPDVCLQSDVQKPSETDYWGFDVVFLVQHNRDFRYCISPKICCCV